MTGIPRELRESHDAASARAAFARYVADRRGHGVPGFRIDRFPPYLRFTADDGASDGCVAYTALSPGHEGRQIDEAVAYFAQTGRAFEWKVYAFDVPADLQARLAERGFVAGDAETLMLLPLATNALADPASGRHPWQIERVSAATGIDGVAAVSRAVWDEPGDDLASQLHATLKTAPRTLSVYLALEEGVPIATGWTEYPVGSSFPELHGGAVIPSARGRGVYRSLMAARLDEVRKRGYADVTVDALPASRPILERMGFRSICRTVPMRWSPDRRAGRAAQSLRSAEGGWSMTLPTAMPTSRTRPIVAPASAPAIIATASTVVVRHERPHRIWFIAGDAAGVMIV